jgi:transposase
VHYSQHQAYLPCRLQPATRTSSFREGTPPTFHDLSSTTSRYSSGIFGIGDIGAATILTIVGDVNRFRSAGHFAAYNGTAPIEASSGDVKRHRLNQGGNRQLNSVIHIAAVTQVRHGGPGKAYLERKLTEHKTNGEAMRALKRQLSDVIYRRLLADQRRREAARGRQAGTRLASA